MDQLLAVPEDQEIDFLYSLIRQDPDFFQTFDRTQFADTPLHLAAAEGRTHLALEIQRLMPSFGRKLNPDGFSPLDLALLRGHVKTVLAMIKLNPELVRVQGREGFTPLHHAAQANAVHSLASFLLICPCSIEELTLRRESAVHVAVKNGNLEAFKVLLGWLKRTDRMGVLRWKDLEGNTLLHIAASTNQPEIMELIVKKVDVNSRNFNHLTALDIVMELGPEVNGQVLRILHSMGAKRGSSINDDLMNFSSLAKYFSSPITIYEKTFKLNVFLDMGLSGQMRNAYLVVAVLIATAMYQSVFSPPGRVNDQAVPVMIFNITTTNNNITSNIGHDELQNRLGTNHGEDEVVLSKNKMDGFVPFMLLNSASFAASLATIILVLPARRYSMFLHTLLVLFMITYVVVGTIAAPPGSMIYTQFITLASYLILFAISLMKVNYAVKFLRFSAAVINNGSNDEIMTYLFQSKYSHTNADGKS